MLLTTTRATIVVPTVTFQLTVPGNQTWAIRSIYAVASKAAGGAPDRAYKLEVATSTGVVAAVGAADPGSEPGEITITWCNAPAAASESADQGIVVAPFNPPPLQPGYTITGTFLNPAAGDSWENALAWYDFALTGNQ